MTQATSVNTKLIDSLAQIILSLSEEEQQRLGQKVLQLSGEELQSKQRTLKQDLIIAAEQLDRGEYTDHDESSLPHLLKAIQERGQQRREQSE